MGIKIPEMNAAGTLTGNEQLELTQLSTSVTITATTISAFASDNSYNDSGSGFVAAGFAVGDTVQVSGFTGNVANNINSGTITALTTAKMTIGGTDGDVIVDDAAGESVTITKWETVRTTTQDIADLGGGGGGGSSDVGRHMIPFGAGAMFPGPSSGCSSLTLYSGASGQPSDQVLLFDASTAESAHFKMIMPESWDEGTITFVPIWSHSSTTTNFGVVWELSGLAVGDDDTLVANFGTAQTSTDTGGTTDDIYFGPESSAITIAGTPAAGDVVYFRVRRLPSDGSDTLAIDARLHGLKLYINTAASTD